MSKSLELQTIELAHKLIVNPETWTWATAARDADGETCDPWEPRAKRYCAFGALLAVACRLTGQRDDALRVASLAADILTRGYAAPRDGVRALINVNDAHGREVVLLLFERAGRDARPERAGP